MVQRIVPDQGMSAGDVEICAVAFWRHLGWSRASSAGSELLTGTPTVLEQTTSDLTITSKQVNTSATKTPEGTVATGGAVLFKTTGQQAGETYIIRVTVSSDAGRTFVRDIVFQTHD